ncbi:MAG: tyrosine-protein kinase Etk/Wzc [Arenicella sp.]|jgi:tyrosine-protein kinase Etk/Wzc
MNKEKKASNNIVDIKDFLFLWRLIKKNIGLIIIIPIIFYSLGYIYSYRLTDVYGAKTQLLLKSNETYDYQDQIYQGLGAYESFKDAKNQIRILQSRDLILSVVEKMDINVSYFVVGRVRRKEVFGTLPFHAKHKAFNAEYVNENPIKVIVLDEDSFQIEYAIGEQQKMMIGKFEEDLITPDFNLNLTRNYDLNESNISTVMESEYEIVFHSNEYLMSHFQSRMKIENIEHTSILEIQVTDDIAIRAKVFLDTLAAEFIDYSKRSQLEVNANTLENIEKQITEVQNILISIERELLNYKSDNDILNLSKEEEVYFDDYVGYSELNRALNVKLSSVDLLEDYILNSKDEHLLPPSFFILEGDLYLSGKVSEFYEKQLTISEKSNSISENHPQIERLKREMVEIRKDILTYLKNVRSALDKSLINNRKEIEKYKKEIQGIPGSLQGVQNIQRELDVNNKMYLFLLEKKTNTQIAKAGIIPQVQFIEKPSSSGLIGPNRSRLRNLFLLAGLLIGLVVATVRTIFFEKIENIEELERISNLPVLAGIPFLKDLQNGFVIVDQPKAQVTESFRTLRSNVSFFTSTSKTKKIVVSSFFPGEGKTFCSTNFAAILARSGSRVLLIDMDLHKPRVHKALDLENSQGVTNFLIGKSEIGSIINKNVIENLDVITSGIIPPNPSELIVNDKNKELNDYIDENYDFVIIDTPPFGLLNDALEISERADVFLAVTNTKFTRNRGIPVIEKMIGKNDKLQTGFVLNGIKQSTLGYYYAKYSYKYSYGYSYNYGYGYGEEDKD